MKLRTDLPLLWRIRTGMASITIPVLMLMVPLDRLTRWLGQGRVSEAWGSLPDRRMAAWVDSLLERLPPPWRRTCLRRSLVLYHVLRRHGREVELRVGVRRDEARDLVAHAWLTLDARPYLETGPEVHDGYAPIATFPEPVTGGR